VRSVIAERTFSPGMLSLIGYAFKPLCCDPGTLLLTWTVVMEDIGVTLGLVPGSFCPLVLEPAQAPQGVMIE
jgi:hypothetical protein